MSRKLPYRILLFGCGSLGANTALNVAQRFGNRVKFILVDYDKIEVVNLANQPWLDIHIGQSKVVALSQLLYRKAEVEAIPLNFKVEGDDFIGYLNSKVKDSIDLFVDAFDNSKSRIITTKIARLLKKPLLHIGFTEVTYIATWKDIFKGKQDREPICNRRELSTVVNLGAAISESVITEFLLSKKKINLLGDFSQIPKIKTLEVR